MATPAATVPNAGLRNQLDPDRRLRIHALKVVDQLRQILNGIDIVVRRWRNQLHSRLSVPQSRNQLRNFMPRQLPTLTRLRSLRYLDFNLFRVNQVLSRDPKTAARHLLDLVVQQRRSAMHQHIRSRIFPALASIRSPAKQIHPLGNRLVRLGRKRTQ